jgi:hypothetical protein
MSPRCVKSISAVDLMVVIAAFSAFSLADSLQPAAKSANKIKAILISALKQTKIDLLD